MTDDNEHSTLRREAERRVNARYGFYVHATVYAVVNALLAAINLMWSRSTLWFVWPLLGWGIGLFFHGFGVFYSVSGARERAIEAEMARLRAKPG